MKTTTMKTTSLRTNIAPINLDHATLTVCLFANDFGLELHHDAQGFSIRRGDEVVVPATTLGRCRTYLNHVKASSH